ncbi:hypothetical protein [Nibricoccus aquaticus]|uniref:hypothetical protein n=1 Tax=Nibricoccus aquaticus TaxID=2576891 RepID=UPI0010FE81DB|nr:hypothetical protein [Nibricoccus aquaticus]
MSTIAKYEMPDAPERGLKWKEIVFVPVFVSGLLLAFLAFSKWRDPSRDLERSHLYKIAFSHPAITAITGSPTDASFALISKEERRFFSKNVPEDWKRRKEGDSVNGTARMFIIGKSDGGIFTITYRYTLSSDSFVVVHIESLGQRIKVGGDEHSS